MKALEKRIKKNRTAFDAVEGIDTEKMWGCIEKGINENPRKRGALFSLQKISIAASFMLIGGLAMWLFMRNDTIGNEKNTLANFYPEFVETSQKYQKVIAMKEANIPYDSLDYFLFNDILKELEDLEEMHKEVLNDLPQYTQNDRVIDAMMRYYERKMQILERILNEYKKNKQHEKRNEIHI